MMPARRSRLFSLAFLALFASASTWAAEWRIAPIQVGDRTALESRYIYVSRGEQWRGGVYSADFQTTGVASVTLSLDGRPLQSHLLSNRGTLKVSLPVLDPGFHRLDFAFKQQGISKAVQAAAVDGCAFESLEGVTTIGAGKLNYQRARPNGFQIRDLPDALFNPHIVDAPSFVGRLRFDEKQNHELTAIARLASAWPAAAGVRWLDDSVPESSHADFTVELRSSPQLSDGALLSLAEESRAGQGSHPYLLILYKDRQGLESAVNALLNREYLAQIRTGKISIPDSIAAPLWGRLKNIETLADLGVEDFRLDSSSRSIPLILPGAWQPLDILQGTIALRAQSGLMQGSKLTVWLDDALAGSHRLDELASETTQMELHYVGRAIPVNTNFDLRLESTLIASGDCLPRSRGSLWVDAHKSKLKLPHRLKSGVSGISPALIPHPDISVDGSAGATSIAVTLLQIASGMLLDSPSIAANVHLQTKGETATVRVRTDAALYRQRIATHEDKVFGPYATGGVIIIAVENHYEIVAESVDSAVGFMYRWPRVQAQIPDAATEVLITRDGDAIVLDRYIPGTTETPAVHESTVSILMVLVFVFMLAVIFWWLWRNRKYANTLH